MRTALPVVAAGCFWLLMSGCTEESTTTAQVEEAAADTAEVSSPATAPSEIVETAPTEDAEPAEPQLVIEPSTPSPMAYTLAAQGLPTSGMWKSDPLLADINDDGHLDLIAHPRLAKGLKVFIGNSRGMWVDSSEGLAMNNSCGGGMAIEDLNGDGHLDIALADHCNGIFVYLGDGQGRWRMVVEAMYPAGIAPNEGREPLFLGVEDLDLGDFNGDGHIDILGGAADEGGIHIYTGDGTGENWVRLNNTGLPWDGWAMRTRAVDMNGDGMVDVVAAHSAGPIVWLNNGDGSFDPASIGLPEPRVHGIYQAIEVADLNQDDRPDIVCATLINGIETFYQQADGTWSNGPDPMPGLTGGATGIDLGDLDGDGDLDIVAAGKFDRETFGFVRGIFALQNNGDDGWVYMADSGLPPTGLSTTSGVLIDDFDLDGTADVIVLSGLTVESWPGSTGPIVEPRVLVWRASGQATETTDATLAQETD